MKDISERINEAADRFLEILRNGKYTDLFDMDNMIIAWNAFVWETSKGSSLQIYRLWDLNDVALFMEQGYWKQCIREKETIDPNKWRFMIGRIDHDGDRIWVDRYQRGLELMGDLRKEFCEWMATVAPLFIKDEIIAIFRYNNTLDFKWLDYEPRTRKFSLVY